MSRRTRPLLALIGAGAALAVAAAGMQPGAAAQGKPKGPPAKPTKVVIIVVDSLSKEIVDKYGMTNVKGLMDDGVDTPRSYLGHTGSVTVVTHNVITSGQLPKHMGWTTRATATSTTSWVPRARQPRPASTSPATVTDLSSCSRRRATPSSPTTSMPRTRRPSSSRSARRGTPAYAFGSAGVRLDHHLQQRHLRRHPGSWRQPGGVNVPSYILGGDCSTVLGAQRLSATRRNTTTPTTPPSCPRCSTRSTATAT